MSSIKYKYVAEQDGVMLQDIYFASTKEPLFKKGQDVKMQVYDKVVIGRNGKESVVDRVYAVGGIKQDSRFPVPFGKGRFVRLGTEVGFVPPEKPKDLGLGISMTQQESMNSVIKPVVDIPRDEYEFDVDYKYRPKVKKGFGDPLKNKKWILYVLIAVAGYFAYKKFKK